MIKGFNLNKTLSSIPESEYSCKCKFCSRSFKETGFWCFNHVKQYDYCSECNMDPKKESEEHKNLRQISSNVSEMLRIFK